MRDDEPIRWLMEMMMVDHEMRYQMMMVDCEMIVNC